MIGRAKNESDYWMLLNFTSESAEEFAFPIVIEPRGTYVLVAGENSACAMFECFMSGNIEIDVAPTFEQIAGKYAESSGLYRGYLDHLPGTIRGAMS